MNSTWLNLDSAKPLRFIKEAIYADEFNKDGDPFSISPGMLQRLADSVTELRSAGIEIPFALGHDDWMSADKRLGDIVGAEVGANDNGKPALFLGIEFADEKSRDLALKADVSIGYLGEFLDGKGVLHKQVLRHVAATSAPVIPALSEWAALAASFGGKTTDMSKILEHLGVDNEDAALAAIQALQAAKPVEKVELSHPPLVIRTLRDAREQSLDAMVTKGEISPAVKAELVLSFCTDKQVGLELSHNSNGEAFDAAVKIAKLASTSRPLAATGRSSTPGKNEIELSHAGGGTDGLDKAIEKLVEQHKARTAR